MAVIKAEVLVASAAMSTESSTLLAVIASALVVKIHAYIST